MSEVIIMLDENELVFSETRNYGITYQWFKFQCECGKEIVFDYNNLDEVLLVDPHFPNCEAIICPECGKVHELYKNHVDVVGKDGRNYKLFTDGTFDLVEGEDGSIYRVS